MISVHFYRANTFLGYLVRLFGQTEFVHCALQIDGKHVIETDFGGKVKLHHIDKKPSERLFFELSDEMETLLLTKFNSLMNSKYDTTAIWGFLLHIFKQNPDRFTCVELVCELLEACGFQFEEKNIRPDALYASLQTLIESKTSF